MSTRTKQQPLLMRAAAMLLLAVLVLAAVPQRAGAQTPATIGGIVYNSVGGYYEINEPDDLRDLATYVNGTGTYRDSTTETTAHDCSGLKFKMTQDITFTYTTAWDDADCEQENNYVAIGCYYNYNDRYFSGDFDGADHTISGIRIYRSGNANADQLQGIFGQTDGATIHNLRLADARITGHRYTGGIVGYNWGGTVTDCHVASNVCIHAAKTQANVHSGIAGWNSGTVGNCTSAATLTIASDANGCNYYGAIAGYNGGTLRDNLAIGATVPAASNNDHGAIVGSNTGFLQRNYYTACKVAGVENATDVGCQNADVATNDGAVPALLTQNENTYTISNTGGWNVFCYLLAENDKGYFSDKTVKLGADITVTRMAGDSGHEFTGTFDGQGHTLTVNYGSASAPLDAEFVAPFVETDRDTSPTFRNLTIDGHIYAAYTGSSDSGVGGLIGHLFGTVTIEGCTSTVEINSTKDRVGGFVGLCEHAVTFTNCKSSAVVTCTGSGSGFVGWSRSSIHTIAFEGCLFNGKILKKNGIGDGNGGFVGWKGDKKIVTVTNCLVAPAALDEGETMADGSSATFSREHDGYPATITNCYYTEAFGREQGKQVLYHEAVSADFWEHATYNVSGLIFYGNGVQCGSTFYYNPERNFLRTVKGHGGDNGSGWNLIASPLASSGPPSEVQNLFPSAGETSNDYDLYRFNQSAEKEWQNYKVHNNDYTNPFWLLVRGQGYLYANANNVDLVFIGEPYSGSGEVYLTYSTTNLDANMHGWNLIGNPFAVGATPSQPYYRMNDEGSALKTEAETTPVAAMEGVFVKATGDGQTVTFTAQTRGSEKRAVAALHIKVGSTAGAGTLDNAILRFDGGQTLEKFSFREGSTKLYIPQGGKEYAIATIGTDVARNVSTEIPINFKATEDGTYTLTINPENVDLDYLHLIDNLTGMDVDLLAANGRDAKFCVSTYTFTAKTSDYESRFKLVFAASADADSDDDAPFAFVSNGEIIINDADAGNASLQIVDVMGRVIRDCTDVARNVSTQGMTAGVYVLRLINGENVKVQKVVVR